MEQIVRAAFALVALTGWVLLWWFAFRFLMGNRSGMLHWVPVALCAFGVPMMAADWIATHEFSKTSEAQFLVIWGLLGVLALTIGFFRTRSKQRHSL